MIIHTEPLKVRKVLTISSSEKNGCRATKLMNLPRARLLPSMNSRSETEVRTMDKYQGNKIILAPSEEYKHSNQACGPCHICCKSKCLSVLCINLNYNFYRNQLILGLFTSLVQGQTVKRIKDKVPQLMSVYSASAEG